LGNLLITEGSGMWKFSRPARKLSTRKSGGRNGGGGGTWAWEKALVF